jgi:hypothetical protein
MGFYSSPVVGWLCIFNNMVSLRLEIPCRMETNACHMPYITAFTDMSSTGGTEVVAVIEANNTLGFET